MQTPISVQDKKAFIQWFLNNYQLKKRESVWILNYLTNHQEILANVHFVRSIKSCPRSIIMTSRCSAEASFRFNKKHLVTADADKAFHDIRLNRHEALYIQLNFKKANQNSFYASVLEENPFTPDEAFITKKDQDLAKKLSEISLDDYKKKSLIRAVDRALDEMNQTEFMKLTKELHELNLSDFNQPKILK